MVKGKTVAVIRKEFELVINTSLKLGLSGNMKVDNLGCLSIIIFQTLDTSLTSAA